MPLKNVIKEQSVNQVLETIYNLPCPNENPISVSSNEALNYILANDAVAKRDVPAFDNSAMDGFIFRKENLDNGRRRFPVVAEIRPETKSPSPIKSNTCARILTGAPIPLYGTQVVPVEFVKESEGEVEVLKIPEKNPIRKQGEGYRRGETVLEKGTVIRPYETGLLIESGNIDCDVKKPLEISLQITGSELDDSNNTTGPVLEQIISQWPGVVVRRLPVLDDSKKAVKNRLSELKEHSNVVITTGGISAGKYDYLFDTMKELGAEILARNVKQKPGKPFTITMAENTPFIHLPGNPVSSVFCAEYYAKTLIYHLLGIPQPKYIAETKNLLENPRRDKTLFVTGNMSISESGKLMVTADARMRSHLMQLYTGNNVYVRLAPETSYQPGEKVPVIPFSYPSGSFFGK